MTQARTQFDYLLNRLELASQANKPADHGYGEKRKALFAYVRDLEARALLAQAAQPQPAGYVTAIEEGRVLMLPRASLNTDGLVPLFATPPEDKGSQDQ